MLYRAIINLLLLSTLMLSFTSCSEGPKIPPPALAGSNNAESSKIDFEALIRDAEKGDAIAQLTLGLMYFEGDVLSQDYPKALYWFEKSAEQGDPKAQNLLGVIYMEGQVTPQDFEKAFIWTEKAAKQGVSFAQHNLGGIYYNGEGVPQNYQKAFEWFNKAAIQGNTSSQNNLGGMYASGLGVPKDAQKAYQWFSLSFTNGERQAQVGRDTYIKKLTEKEIQEADMWVKNWKPTLEKQPE